MIRSEWEEAFDYLARRLAQTTDSKELSEELRRTAGRAIVVPAEEVWTETQLSKSDRGEMGEFSVRERSPEEKFRFAVELLCARLVEHPLVMNRLRKVLRTENQPIHIAPDDTSEKDAETEYEGTLDANLPDLDTQREIRRAMSKLLQLIGDEEVRRGDTSGA